jgi:hypothetical protein
MKAIVKSMWVDSAAINLKEYWPDDREYFGLWIEFRAGPENESSADDFRVFVCTPAWLRNECTRKKGVWGRDILIVGEYDLDTIKTELRLLVENCAGEEWTDVAQKIARFAAWEFENYQSEA